MMKQDPDVAVVVPMVNEEKSIVSLLGSFEQLTLFPKEIILVDGGSTDQTVETVTHYLEGKKFPYGVQVMILAQALPGRGRNEGIRKTDCPLIACTDAGGHVDPHWLEDLMAPLKANPSCEMVIGNCRSRAKNFFERCTFYMTIESSFKKPFMFLGGASIAFRKKIWEKVKGYPEHLYPCEDKAFLRAVKRRGVTVVFSKGAFVYWQSRTTLWAFFKQYFLYGRGDGEGRFVAHRYLSRFVFYGAVLLFFVVEELYAALLLLSAYLGFVSFRGWVTVKDLRAFFVLPLLFLAKDLSQMLGFCVGIFRRGRGTY